MLETRLYVPPAQQVAGIPNLKNQSRASCQTHMGIGYSTLACRRGQLNLQSTHTVPAMEPSRCCTCVLLPSWHVWLALLPTHRVPAYGYTLLQMQLQSPLQILSHACMGRHKGVKQLSAMARRWFVRGHKMKAIERISSQWVLQQTVHTGRP